MPKELFEHMDVPTTLPLPVPLHLPLTLPLTLLLTLIQTPTRTPNQVVRSTGIDAWRLHAVCLRTRAACRRLGLRARARVKVRVRVRVRIGIRVWVRVRVRVRVRPARLLNLLYPLLRDLERTRHTLRCEVSK